MKLAALAFTVGLLGATALLHFFGPHARYQIITGPARACYLRLDRATGQCWERSSEIGTPWRMVPEPSPRPDKELSDAEVFGPH